MASTLHELAPWMLIVPILILAGGALGLINVPGVMYLATGQSVVVVVVNSTSSVLLSTITGFETTQTVSSTSTGLVTATSTTTNYQPTTTSQSTTQLATTSTVSPSTTSSSSITSSATTYTSGFTSTLTTLTTQTSVTTSSATTITQTSTGSATITTAVTSGQVGHEVGRSGADGGNGNIVGGDKIRGPGGGIISWIQLDPSTNRTVIIIPLGNTQRSLIIEWELLTVLLGSIIVGVLVMNRTRLAH